MFKEAYENIISSAKAKGKIIAAFAANKKQSRDMFKFKADILVSGLDSELLYRAAEDILKEMKEI